MNKYHQEILEELKNHSGQGTKHQAEKEQRYIGTTKYCYNISNPVKTTIIRGWIKKHPDLSFSEYIELLNLLYQGHSHDERSIAGKLLEYLPKLRKNIDPNLLDSWLDKAEGWAEVDSICQSNFTAQEILDNWGIWHKLLVKYTKDNNVHKRRASLVLLTKPTRQSIDPRLVNLAFENIDKLKQEKNILITKAISWLLRDLIKNHKDRVEDYLNENFSTLPKIAIRETRIKLSTGKKNLK